MAGPVVVAQRAQPVSGAPAANKTTAKVPPPTQKLPAPTLAIDYLTFKGYGFDGARQFSVMCGDDPPTVAGGYAKWTVVDRPLQRGATVFQGYDPITMTVNLRFGIWDNTNGWHTSDQAKDTDGYTVEQCIAALEWMAGAQTYSGQSPIVMVNTYNSSGAGTNLVPNQYQSVGNSFSSKDSKYFWVIGNGITWGTSIRSDRGAGDGQAGRVYQECSLTLTNWQGFTAPPIAKAPGTHVTTSLGRDTCLLLANLPQVGPAFNPQALAQAIRSSSRNNPITKSKIHLSSHMLNWKIPDGKSVFIPSHLG